MKRLFAAMTAALLMVALVSGAAFAAGKTTSTIYSSLLSSPLHGNMPSLGGEAYAFSEIGNDVTFASKNRSLTNVTVTMSSWGCQTGHWYSGDCFTAPGATFSVPITFSVYKSDGTTIAVTQTFAIPFRPSANPTRCPANPSYYAPNAVGWYDTATKSCYNGLATNITFAFGGQTVTNSATYGIAYNTTHYGYARIGEGAACFTSSGGCGYDSLNVALSTEADVSVGVDNVVGSILLDLTPTTVYAPYVPAVQFKAAS